MNPSGRSISLWLCLGPSLLASAGCGAGDELTAPVTGSVVVATLSSGSAVDSNGYGIRIDGGDAHAVARTGSVLISGLDPGEHDVEIVDLASTCALPDPNPRKVSIVSGATVRVDFRITCTGPAEVGLVQVAVTTTGADLDPDGYTALVDPSRRLPVALDGAVVFDSVPVGSQVVRLEGLADNCTARPDPDTVTVPVGDTARSAFEVTCWPPITGRIAFSRDGDIYVQKADGSGLQHLTGLVDSDENGNPVDTLSDEQPAWSPDGTKLAFVREFTLFVMDADGANPARLTPDTLSDFQEEPRWSPDGSKLLFLGDRTDFGGALYVINADGTGLTKLPINSVLSASWSPNGQRLALLHVFFERCCTESYELLLMNSTGGGLLDITPEEFGFALDVAWSPDGSRLAWVNSGIFLSDTLGTSVERIVSNDNLLPAVTWSPDGVRLAFEAGFFDDPSLGISIVNRDGSGRVRVTAPPQPQDPFEDPIRDEDAAWGP